MKIIACSFTSIKIEITYEPALVSPLPPQPLTITSTQEPSSNFNELLRSIIAFLLKKSICLLDGIPVTCSTAFRSTFAEIPLEDKMI